MVHANENWDSIGMVEVPWVYDEDGCFFAGWLDCKNRVGPFKTIEDLLVQFLVEPLREWKMVMTVETEARFYRTSGVTWVRLINGNRPPFPGEETSLVGSKALWRRIGKGGQVIEQ
jgi:hypothetical protein